MNFQLIYISHAEDFVGDAQLTDILAASRIRNASFGVTGMLLFADRRFIQVLEGAEAHVEDIFASIFRDPRHRDVVVVLREFIPRRNFKDWSMGFERLSPSHAGLRDVFRIGRAAIEARLSDADAALVREFVFGFSPGATV